MSIFIERLKKLITEENMKQKDFAKKINVPPSQLSYYMNGREPNYDKLIEIANYFGVSVDYLLGRDDFKIPEEGDLLKTVQNISEKKEANINIEKINPESLKNIQTTIVDVYIALLELYSEDENMQVTKHRKADSFFDMILYSLSQIAALASYTNLILFPPKKITPEDKEMALRDLFRRIINPNELAYNAWEDYMEELLDETISNGMSKEAVKKLAKEFYKREVSYEYEISKEKLEEMANEYLNEKKE